MLGVLIYQILLYIRPQDWTNFVADPPLVFLILGLTGVFAAFKYVSQKVKPYVPQVYFLILYLAMVYFYTFVSVDFDSAYEQIVMFSKNVITFFLLFRID